MLVHIIAVFDLKSIHLRLILNFSFRLNSELRQEFILTVGALGATLGIKAKRCLSFRNYFMPFLWNTKF